MYYQNGSSSSYSLDNVVKFFQCDVGRDTDMAVAAGIRGDADHV